MEARAYTVAILNYLMFMSILISAFLSIVQVPLQDSSHSPVIFSALSAFVAFILSIINYLKLDAESEAHKISAHNYDKLQSYVEFQSGQVLLFSDPILNQDNVIWHQDSGEGSGRYSEVNDLVQKRLSAEMDLIERMREKYSLIYNTNIFSVIKKIDDYRSKTLTELKNVKNEMRFINSMQKQKINTYNQRATDLFKKKKKIIHTILYLNTAFSMIDKMFQREIDNVKLKQHNCVSFYLNEMFNQWCGQWCGGRKKRRRQNMCCLPTQYAQPDSSGTSNMLEKIMGVELLAPILAPILVPGSG